MRKRDLLARNKFLYDTLLLVKFFCHSLLLTSARRAAPDAGRNHDRGRQPCPLRSGVLMPQETASRDGCNLAGQDDKDLPPMPVPRRTSKSCTSAAFARHLPHRQKAVTEKNSMTPMARMLSSIVAEWIAEITCG